LTKKYPLYKKLNIINFLILPAIFIGTIISTIIVNDSYIVKLSLPVPLGISLFVWVVLFETAYLYNYYRKKEEEG